MSLAHAPPADRTRRQPFLAADVGGTHVRLGRVCASGDPAQPITVLDYRTYVCADYDGLEPVIADFLGAGGETAVSGGVIASAGYQLEDGRLISANLPWVVQLAQLRAMPGLGDLRLVNDFEAVAHAAPYFDTSEVLHLAGPAHAVSGPVLVLGPGTGFGSALWIPSAAGPTVLATEAGQAALAVGTDLEIALLQELLRTRSHLPVEHLLSGPGLLNLYVALCALHGEAPVCTTPREVSDAGITGREARAVESLSVFCGLLGSTAGDLALTYGAQGGVYLAGGILPGIREFLVRSRFVERFLDKGLMREALERIPVKLVEHGRLGVLGAASWYLGQSGPS